MKETVINIVNNVLIITSYHEVTKDMIKYFGSIYSDNCEGNKFKITIRDNIAKITTITLLK